MTEGAKKAVVHYIGTLDDGSEFDSSYSKGTPLRFILGAGLMIPGFDAAVAKMSVGEKVSIHLEPKDAYGEYKPTLVGRLPLYMISGVADLEVGQMIVAKQEGSDQSYPARVVRIGEDHVIVDANHELAGKNLNFDIELLDLVEIAPPGQAG